ncbi:FadR/GntR family transcriptional regulator [Halomonas piscis]|uniref:FadR/GntR family transcriptional regulator n=1 Tax=Halomonas piscis TaxID=3031727 RepID=UPI00289FCAF3|nr:FCD domain-containing protein [Halomonas piscis]
MDRTPSPRRRQKLAELISDDIKRWIATEGMTEGDRLPNEKTLIELYGCAKGTIREALKILEVEGLIALKTGPGGGAILRTPNMEPASRMLRNFLHFRSLDGPQVYQLRRLLEVEMAVTVIGQLSKADLDKLEANISACESSYPNDEDQRRQRFLELEFHNLLARACPNPLLSFMCRFLNDMLRDLVVVKKAYVPERKQFDKANHRYHRELIDAFRAEDAERVRRLMEEHMCDAEHHMSALEGEMAEQLLVSLNTFNEPADASPLLRLVNNNQ